MYAGGIGSGTFGDSFDFSFDSVFEYSREDGNLLLTVEITSANTGSRTWFDAGFLNGISRVYSESVVDVGYGLVTGFNEAEPADDENGEVPVPAPLALIALGLLAIRLARVSKN